jgi:cyclophilin family peptidyl-prolyl cis-trans isomerase
MKSNGNKYCYYDICIGGQPLDRVVFELYYKECPNTCENFLSLCRGFTNQEGEKVTYRDTIFHRVVKRGYIQGGDLANLSKSLN